MRLSNLLFLLCYCATVYGQGIKPKSGDFIFPIRPQQENYLSGTVGELRRTHFHTGLDIKTSGITGLPVHAVAEGYIQRIRVSLGGYGNALYVAHPHNNTISVYAHLESFDPAIAAFVREQQYKNQSFEVNLFPKKNQFAFEQGDVIARSGNSGSSSGPHLHFEIRTKEHLALDPLQFGFDEIDDTTPPILSKVAFVTKDEHARINGSFGRHEFDVVDVDGGLPMLKKPVFLTGKIGVEIYAFDRFDGANNRNGVLQQSLVFDGDEIFKQSIDHLQFNLARNILVHTDYKRSVEGGRRFNKLFIDDGNMLGFYEANENEGVLHIKDPLPHTLDIRLADSYGNVTQHHFEINGKELSNDETKVSRNLEKSGYDILGNILEFKTDLTEHGYCEAQLFIDEDVENVQLAYDRDNMGYYLWDLRKGLPDSLRVCNEWFNLNFSEMILPDRKADWESDSISITFLKNSLFDTTYLRYKREVIVDQEFFRFFNAATPMRKNVMAEIYASGEYNQEKAAIYTVNSRGNLSFVGGIWSDNHISFKTRELTDFTIATDSIPPTIEPMRTKDLSLKFRIKDNLSGIKSIRAELDGKWVLMNYDAKYNVIWSDSKVNIRGAYKLEIRDNANNLAVFENEY